MAEHKNKVVERRGTKGYAAFFVDGKEVEANLRALGCPEWLAKRAAERTNAPGVLNAEVEALRDKLSSISLF